MGCNHWKYLLEVVPQQTLCSLCLLRLLSHAIEGPLVWDTDVNGIVNLNGDINLTS